MNDFNRPPRTVVELFEKHASNPAEMQDKKCFSATQLLPLILIVFTVLNGLLLLLFLFAKPAPSLESLWFIPVTGMVFCGAGAALTLFDK